jgi:hypothetical protein
MRDVKPLRVGRPPKPLTRTIQRVGGSPEGPVGGVAQTAGLQNGCIPAIRIRFGLQTDARSAGRGVRPEGFEPPTRRLEVCRSIP